MANQVNHRSRLEGVLAGDKPDRVPVSLWRHFPVDDQSPGLLAAASLAFQFQFDFDFVKLTPASSFCVRDWGVEDRWVGNLEGTREYTHQIIQKPEDWRSLVKLNPRQGHLGAQIECLRLVKSALPSDTPLVQTVFSPLAQAKNMVGKEKLIEHIRTSPTDLAAGLHIIAQTTQDFIEEAVKIGVDGVFFAIQHAQNHLLSAEEFERFGRAFDKPTLEPAKDLWLNIVHIHGENVLFSQLIDYPVCILNWHDRQTPPTLSEAQSIYPGVVCGGIRQWDTLVYGDPEQVRAEALDAIQLTGGKRFILSTGCVSPIITPYGNLMAVRRVVEDLSQ